MAEVATKKSISVVSSKKTEVCSVVQSNNGLIDLDNITASNNQLISLCDNNDDEDDLILTNNTRNELAQEDKSLQELIESELALRICSSNEDEPAVKVEDQEQQEETSGQPEAVKRIVLDLDRREDPLDVNTEFIMAEVEHGALIEEPYGYQNGHASPGTKVTDATSEERVKPEPNRLGFRDEEQEEVVEQVFTEPAEVGGTITVEKTNDETEQTTRDEEKLVPVDDSVASCPDYPDVKETPEEDARDEPVEENPEVIPAITVSCVDKYQQEEVQAKVTDDMAGDEELSDLIETDRKEELVETCWSEQSNHGDGQFSDNFDEALCQQSQVVEQNGNQDSAQDSNVAEDLATGQDVQDCSKEFPGTVRMMAEDLLCSEPEKQTQEPVQEGLEKVQVSKPLEECALSQREAASTQEFLDTERRILSEEEPFEPEIQEPLEKTYDQDTRLDDETNDDQNQIVESSSELSVSESTFIEKTEIVVSETSMTVYTETRCVGSMNDLEQLEGPRNDLDSWTTVEEATKMAEEEEQEERKQEQVLECTEEKKDQEKTTLRTRAPLATPDDETSDVSNACDSESREETITSSSSVVSTSTAKAGTKTKKKKIEGVAGNDASSPNLTPRTKKTKKSKKSDLEKENISVNSNLQDASMHTTSPRQTQPEMIDFSDEDDLSNVNVKSLKSSFNKFDALSKKTVLHVRSVDAGKVQQQLNAVGQNGDTNPNCRSCGKVVFQMEQTKAEGLVWHKNCFRCVQCSKQLNVDNYESHESTLYCKPHFKELFQPKPVEESDQPASDKPDLGLEELSSLNVKSRFQVFEKAGTEANEIERSPSQIAVKRSPSILSKLAKFQAKGMDIGVADESLNGIPYEESSESEEEEETEETEETETEIVKAKRATRERPISFSKMDDIKNRWESTSQQGRREVQREARKEEIAGIRSRLFMGKQGKMKEMYQQAVAGTERVNKINAAEEIQHSTHARSIKERFERGEPIAASDDEAENKPKPEKADEEVIAAGISRKSRSMFLELDATAAKTGRPVTPVNQKTPAEAPRRARDMDSPEREIYRDPDVVRAEDRVDEVVHTDTARKMLSIFRQMEENACKKELPNGPKPLKRFTPPPEDKFAKPTASDSEEEEEEEGEESEAEESAEERDPNYVRASDKVEDEFLKQAQTAARAKTLCAKFEHWEETDGKVSSTQNIAEMEIAQGTGEQSSIESASSLRARFESLGSQPSESPRTPKVKVNRFVEIQTSCMDVCESCEKKVYPLEKVETNNKIFHKQCFRCLQCNCVLRMDTFTLNNGKLYCIPHFKQLFITRGNYDEGFGVDPHKNKWSNASNSTSPSPIAVSNGDL